jgi:tetratricopeptide (TPR) repeat protein
MWIRGLPWKAGLVAAVGLFLGCMAARGTPQEWIEVRSPHFTVVSNAGSRPARRTAMHFEQLRAVFRAALPRVRVDTGRPVIVVAVRDEADLRALLPGFWEKEGAKHPSGIFVAGPEKHFVALRLDVKGDNPYRVIYHEYVHLLVRLNFDRLPLWLNEGLAELYGNTTVSKREVGLGRPIPYHLANLQSKKRIPLQTLLTADPASPFYNEANKATLFYAQSWALTHYLTLGDKSAHQALLIRYLKLLDQGASDIEAAQGAFGDLAELSAALEAYVRQNAYYYLPIRARFDLEEQALELRELSQAESAAIRGDFHLHTKRPAEARRLLEEALRLDPELALGYESMGLLNLREDNRAKALRSFDRAVQLDSQSFLAHHYRAALTLRPGATPESLARAEQDLRRAIELNPDFAPAYSVLAALLALRAERLEEALDTARKAVALEPGVPQHQLNLGNILLRAGNVKGAEEIGQRVLKTARFPRERDLARVLLERVRRAEAEAAPNPRAPRVPRGSN